MNSTSTLTSSDNFKETLKQQADIVRICGRLRQAEEGGGAELFGALSVSCGEDAFVFGACHAAVLSPPGRRHSAVSGQQKQVLRSAQDDKVELE